MGNNVELTTAYKILNISEAEASCKETLKRSWQRLRSYTHPDRPTGNKTLFNDVNNAYQLLASLPPRTKNKTQYKKQQQHFVVTESIRHVVTYNDLLNGTRITVLSNTLGTITDFVIPRGSKPDTVFKRYYPDHFVMLHVTLVLSMRGGWFYASSLGLSHFNSDIAISINVHRNVIKKGGFVEVNHLNGKRYKVRVPVGEDVLRMPTYGLPTKTHKGVSEYDRLFYMGDAYIQLVPDSSQPHPLLIRVIRTLKRVFSFRKK